MGVEFEEICSDVHGSFYGVGCGDIRDAVVFLEVSRPRDRYARGIQVYDAGNTMELCSDRNCRFSDRGRSVYCVWADVRCSAGRADPNLAPGRGGTEDISART